MTHTQNKTFKKRYIIKKKDSNGNPTTEGYNELSVKCSRELQQQSHSSKRRINELKNKMFEIIQLKEKNGVSENVYRT